MKDNADVILILEPHEVYNFLNYGVSKWITWAPAKIELLQPHMTLSWLQMAIRWDILGK